MIKFTEKSPTGKNCIPLKNAAQGIDLPKWSIHETTFLESRLEGDAADQLAAYESTGLEPDEIPHWIPCSEKLPEYDELLQIYEDSTMKLISVLACGHLDGDEELSFCEVNRLLIKKTGIKQLDVQYTGEWEWSNHFKDVIYWQPLPQLPKGEGHEH